MSVSNTGTWLEREIATIAKFYRERALMRLEKVAPPTLVVGRKVLHLKNPFLDFIGSWTERAGRTICLEAKSTEKPTLGLISGSGITQSQWDNLILWQQCGAATGVLWGYQGEIRFCPMPAMQAQLRRDTKHLRWEHATPIPKGMGFVTFDFIQTLRDYHPASIDSAS